MPKRKKTPAWAVAARNVLYTWLRERRIEEEVRVEVWKKVPKVDGPCVGSYVRMSQWRGLPTFRLAASLPRAVRAVWKGLETTTSLPTEILRAAAETLAHEYGHVVWEFAEKSSSPHPSRLTLREKVLAWEAGEEDFAEGFMLEIARDDGPDGMNEIVKLYAEVLASERD